MTYNADLTWTDLSVILKQHGGAVMQVLINGKAQYDEWQSYRAGRSDADIATALGRTSAEVADMDAAFASLLNLYNYLTNVSQTAGDHAFSLRKFT